MDNGRGKMKIIRGKLIKVYGKQESVIPWITNNECKELEAEIEVSDQPNRRSEMKKIFEIEWDENWDKRFKLDIVASAIKDALHTYYLHHYKKSVLVDVCELPDQSKQETRFGDICSHCGNEKALHRCDFCKPKQECKCLNPKQYSYSAEMKIKHDNCLECHLPIKPQFNRDGVSPYIPDGQRAEPIKPQPQVPEKIKILVEQGSDADVFQDKINEIISYLNRTLEE